MKHCIQKICPVILRQRGEPWQILVFRHPLAGTQLIKSTLEPGERPGLVKWQKSNSTLRSLQLGMPVERASVWCVISQRTAAASHAADALLANRFRAEWSFAIRRCLSMGG